MKILFYVLIAIQASCGQPNATSTNDQITIEEQQVSDTLRVGAEQYNVYLPKLKGRKVACVTNQTSVVRSKHLLDFLKENDINITKIFALEHGIRGKADAGEHINNGLDSLTGAKIISLYGTNKKPSLSDLADVDVVLFDIQDVGVRFYTFISSLHYIMDGVAEAKKELIVLDRPNPHAHYIDGPILKPAFQSFVGVDPLPIVYGLTIGELANMINGEGWLNNQQKCNLAVVPCENYDRDVPYDLPIKPSPNLPNLRAIVLYPSLCLFEGTNVSVGRGTNTQFQVFGAPTFKNSFEYAFVPIPFEGAKTPMHQGIACYGKDLSSINALRFSGLKKINFGYLVEAYAAAKKANDPFFTNAAFFDKLAGTDQIRILLSAGKNEDAIRASYQEELAAFRKIRERYLLY